MLFVVLMGGPGAGKGTQARLLEKALGLPQVASGDLFRQNLKNETELGRLANAYMEKGELVPDEVTVAMIRARLSRPDCAQGAILDGFPRTIPQAAALDEQLAELDGRVNLAPYIHVDPAELLRRLSGRYTCRANGHVFNILTNPPERPGVCDYDGSPLYQREDDSAETQTRRIEVYFNQTAPLLEHYRQRGLLVEMNGEREIEEVHADLLKVIRNAEPSAG
ncbi:MAG: adenylate kinase [Candidatus Promineifilaceae bacterium]